MGTQRQSKKNNLFSNTLSMRYLHSLYFVSCRELTPHFSEKSVICLKLAPGMEYD